MRQHKYMKIFILAVLLVGYAALAAAGDRIPLKPARTDRCPVCGMFVYKYPDWTASIVLDTGTVLYFDGAKDLFKFYLDPKKYRPDLGRQNIIAIYVTEYYDVKPIDARKAFFVLGSDIYGPMGRELIAFGSDADARQFMQDHKGKRILQFSRITASIIEKLD
jgi:nitrous oxide reductase accessory protein NosL